MAAESQPIQREPLRVTPDQLIDSNQSPFSKERIAAYKSAKDEGKLVLFKLCADARSGPSLFNFDAAAVEMQYDIMESVLLLLRHTSTGLSPKTKDSLMGVEVRTHLELCIITNQIWTVSQTLMWPIT